MKHEFDFKLDDEHQSIEELWVTLGDLAFNRVNDNFAMKTKGLGYPVSLRERQIYTAEVIVTAIKNTHEKMRDVEALTSS